MPYLTNPRGIKRLYSGAGAGKGIPGGQRGGRHNLPCPEEGPGYGQGGGKGGGLIRTDLQGGGTLALGIAGELVSLTWFAMGCIGAYTTLKWVFKGK